MTTAAALVKKANLEVVMSAKSSSRVEVVGHLLGVPTWSARTAAVLGDTAADPVRLVTIALNSPEYLTN